LRSTLDDVKGVGEKTRTLLLRKAGSVDALAGASVEDLVAMGATEKQAKAIAEHLQRPNPAESEVGDVIESEAADSASEELALDNAFSDDTSTT
jgi:ERCC4-type nuclease